MAETRLLLVVGLVALAGPSGADVWDSATNNDDSATTSSWLIHGTDQTHDLGVLPGPAPDQDWYRMPQAPHASYEVVVEGFTGDVNGPVPPTLERVASDGTTVVQVAATVLGTSPLTMSWQNDAAAYRDDFVRVRDAACLLSCTPDDQYRIRAYETTYSLPRFNNTGSQATVLILQNPADYGMQGAIWFWSAAGSPLGSQVFAIGPKAALVLPTASVPGASGQSGTITVSHSGRYGDLAGKSVALEPSTGFSFDTPLVPRLK
jgi:hypothetical protein